MTGGQLTMGAKDRGAKDRGAKDRGANDRGANDRNPCCRPQHLTSLQMISELCAGSLSGGAIGSTEICLYPGDISSGEYIADTRTAG